MFPKKVSQQPAGLAKKFRKGKVPSTRGELSESQNTTRIVQVSRTATGSNLLIASGPVINIVADAHQDAPFVPFGIQDEMDIESPNCNEENALDRPGGALLPLTPQPGPSGVKSPANNNLGMLTVSNEFVSHGSADSGSLDTRLQVDQSPSYISSVFDPISSHIPVKIKEKIWNGEFIDLNILLKSTRDLVNEQNLEGELVQKAIWFVGSSIVYWGRQMQNEKRGPNIGLQSRGVYIRWFGKRGMLWNEFNAKVSHAGNKFSPPAMIVIQLGSNDLVKVKTLELIQNIERDILCLHLLLPNTCIVWSEMLMRRYWHGAKDGKAIERSRKRVIFSINNYVLNDGHCYSASQYPSSRDELV
ncbi:unnamed protein product [Mytilus coruscus]|uniref:SGNH hydrolase-type esterase domain-containing protein n=1 Tax=Mytilus coruscus TaxID=42192 RepID=A0A6J8CHN7_MYTCO|nr:unnamed protein product [Mytilus coruscus]